jgi:hypothetical protein
MGPDAKTIHASGTDLLALINHILDLSTIASGTDVGEIGFKDLSDDVQRTFRHVAEAKRLDFELSSSPDLPPVMSTDEKRLQQALENLRSNAFKFTERCKVILEVTVAREGWSREHDVLNRADAVGDRPLRPRHEHRDRAGQTADPLRGVPAGRRAHEPPIRGHRARSWGTTSCSRASSWTSRGSTA